MTVTRYRVRRIDEEFQCMACGFPIYIGEFAYESASGDAYCSRRCAHEKEPSAIDPETLRDAGRVER